MPPNSTRRTRTRREAEIQQRSDANTPESIQTPSRKRRRVTGPDNARTTTNGAERRSTRMQAAASREATVEPTNDEETEVSELIEDETLKVIRKLRTSDVFVQAVIDFSNDLEIEDQSTRKAYAKIAGRQWSYYMKTPGINIGRGKEAPRSALKAAPAVGAVGSPIQDSHDPNAAFPIHIDLGPDNRISRLHAIIEFDGDNEQWVLFVNSRNGLRVDDFHVEHGKRTVLHSGSVFSINGTEMMFLLPSGEVEIAQSIRNRIKQPKAGDETEEEDDDSPRLPQNHLKTSSPRTGSGAHKSYQQSSQSYGQHAPQQNGHGQSSFAAAPSSTSAQPGTPGPKSGQVKVKASPVYSRGLMIESTQEIDYADDSAKDFKPPHSYAQLIGQAILATEEKKLTLAKIYDFVRDNYAFYRHTTTGWQNSIRHNLSLNKSFGKVARDTHEPGKGMKWQILPDHLEEFMKKAIPPTRSMRRPGSSGPNSPAAVQASERLQGALASATTTQAPTQAQQRPVSRGIKTERIKTSPRSLTPPLMASFPTATESYTPDRGPARPPMIRTTDLPGPSTNVEARTPISANDGTRSASASASAHHPHYASAHGPNPPGTAPRRAHHVGLTEAASQGSPPALGSTLYAQDGHAGMLLTPLVERHKPQLAPPSSMRAPSHFMNNLMSSPAPFWKFADHVGTTPGRGWGWGSSPVKRPAPEPESEDDEEEISVKNDAGAKDESDQLGKKQKQKQDYAMDRRDKTADPAQPSSPPTLHPPEPVSAHSDAPDADDSHEDSHEDMSPTRTLSRPATRQGPTRPSTAGGAVQALQAQGPPPRMAMPAQMHHMGQPRGLGINGIASGMNGVNGVNGMGRVGEEEEEEGIDLAKGFQGIGNFHRNLMHAGGAGFRGF